MRILSFDIGMKHLAMCKIEYVENKYNILFWDCINIVKTNNIDKNQHLYQCKHELKTKKICNRSSSYLKNSTLPLCKIHYKMHIKKFPESEYKDISKPKKVKVSKLSVHYLSKQLAISLDKLDDEIFDVDYILLENQPRFNIRMKCFASMLFQYCSMRTINNERLKKILYVHPKDALNIYDGPELDKPYKNKYSNKKYHGILVTKYLLREQPHMLVFLENQPTKLDDLCDSFLNGVQFISINCVLNI